jgi:hypothetical protein
MTLQRLGDPSSPAWTTWWGPGALDELIPDPDLRAAVLAEGH